MDGTYQLLLAEDNPADVFLIREAIREQGLPFEICHAADGAEAVRMIEEADSGGKLLCPVMALLDLNLPKKNGEEVLRRIRGNPRCGNIPVIIITSSDRVAERETLARLGVSYYFRKPSTLAKFMEIGVILKRVWEEVQVSHTPTLR